uniref:GP88 family protein n=1 Tax=Streptomyces hazeniae TaxID=3075538 RepID=UPI00374E02B3
MSQTPPRRSVVHAFGWHSQVPGRLGGCPWPTPWHSREHISHFRRRQAGRTFREWQAELDARRAARTRRHQPEGTHS